MAPHVAYPNAIKPALIANINSTPKDDPFVISR